MMNRLLKKYREEVIPSLKEKLREKNALAVPRLVKVIVNMGIGDVAKDKAQREKAINTLAAITGQIPQVRPAKKAIADFKTRRGDPIGLKVTLRGKRAYDFLDRLISLVLPRVRDFQGVSREAFDGHGNYTLGLTEQVIFPEVDYDKIDRIRGLEISLVTSAKNDEEALLLLSALGMPFEKFEKNEK